ncbi:aldo/keto reductase [Plantactinospora soyae]|uniref:Aryl-alcohol dehydrogenase-like predicted oxidoreductase n=1 Tax=Plantactinospora soyae TaxID=1544732 RepID=A0A927MEV3_9ACTN|nr:aldo/keto reductase [Plantactinospora soyae]MBE1492380.1 aryl-alcohol dehydrogenase-like predicted oxidoreductase [Plantactinospora soyae]
MKTVPLGQTGEQVSQFALGCMLMGTLADDESSYAMLDRYLDAGGTFLDTANCYAWWPGPPFRGGESESLLGRWLHRTGRRDEVFLATKGSAWIRDVDAVRDNPHDPAAASRQYEGAGAQTLRQALDDSLRRLGTDHVDLYYVHVDDRNTPLEETLEALAGLVAAGKTRYVGWSNIRTWRLERIRQLADRYGWPAPVALQQQHSYLRPRPGADTRSIVDDEQLDYLRANDDLTLVAYSPILKGSYDDLTKRRDHHVMASYRGADADARFAVVAEIAAEFGVTGNQLVLAWLLHQRDPEFVTLIGPRTPEQYASALPALDIALTDEHLARLAAAGEGTDG